VSRASRLATGGILAAGEGSRLKRDGWDLPKPLVPVAGVSLLEHTLGNFQAAGIRRVSIIFNETEEACARIARERFPKIDLDIVIRTTASSYESYRTIAPRLGTGAALVSTIDAWCPQESFVAFVDAASATADSTILAVTRFVEDERPLWVSIDPSGRVTGVGGGSGDAVTAGIYVFSERARRRAPADLPRLRDYLAWLVQNGEPVRAIEIPKVVDVDRAADVAAAEEMARGSGLGTRDSGLDRSRSTPSAQSRSAKQRFAAQHERRAPSALCWGIYRELAHSPGRETDDAEILRAAARSLSEQGFQVELKSPDELPESEDAAGVPPFLFVMCEREEVVRRLSAWERQGVRIVNSPVAIRNTDRERAIALFSERAVPFPRSVLVSTADPQAFPLPCWIKRADVHATQAGDVSLAESPEQLAQRLSALRARGIARAVLQEHVPGDLIKFYGVREAQENRPLSWFEWFYHRDQQLSRHPFEVAELREAVARAASALGLDVFGGDAIATPQGRVVLIDLNAWPSFALYRTEAAERIAALLAIRFRKESVVVTNSR
jgi:GTP:adenosylcobinamide-phosphate guanylyltransferase/glutathione synthase/RimK-type ligase-like ATP-grasp enzyme